MAVKTYKSKAMVVIVGSQAYGVADGEFLTVEYEEDLFSDAQGADGEVVRSKNPGSMLNVRLTLWQTSTFNGVLSALALADEIVPFLVQEGLNVIAGGECWVKSMPSVTYAKEAGNREWGLRVAQATTFTLGGNT